MLNFAVGIAKKNTCMLRENMNETRLNIKIREVSQSHQNVAAGHIIMSSSAHSGTFLLDIILCIIKASWTKNGIRQITHSNLKVIYCLPFWFDALSYLKFKEFLRTFLLWKLSKSKCKKHGIFYMLGKVILSIFRHF